MGGLANLQVEVVSPLEVEGMHPGSTGSIEVGILALVVLQVVVLLDEVPEGNAVVVGSKLDL